MKTKITAVLLCVALLLTLSVNVSAQEFDKQTQKLQGIQSTSITNEIMVTVGENGNAVITETITPIDSVSVQSSTTPTGYLEVVSETEIRGWAYHSVIPNASLEVNIYVTNQTTGESTIYVTLADLYRGDLAAAGYGNGYHGFSMSMNWMTYIPGTYTVAAYAIGENWAVGQLTYSPATYTVRNVEGDIDIIASDYVQGWVWKPDAPNEPLDVHAYVYRSNGDLYGVYTATANIYRDDLLNAGKGNGYHGFIIGINFYAMPEERLTVEFHYIDNSGYYPAFYTGYYNNQAIHLIGMIDNEGRDHSTWATQEVINYAENIGAPSVKKIRGATSENLLNYISDSYFATVFTHGTRNSLDWSEVKSDGTINIGSLYRRQMLSIDYGYFENTNCLLLLACSTAETGGMENNNNIAQSFVDKGVKTVVAFSDTIYSAFSNGTTLLTTQGAGYWGKVFLQEVGDGATIDSASDRAFNKLIENQCDTFNKTEEEYHILCEDDPEYVNKFIHCGMDSCVILGENQAIKR